MKATDAQVQRIIDEIDTNDGTDLHDRIRRALKPILDEVVSDVLRRSLHLARTDYQHNPTEAVIRAADEMGVEL